MVKNGKQAEAHAEIPFRPAAAPAAAAAARTPPVAAPAPRLPRKATVWQAAIHVPYRPGPDSAGPASSKTTTTTRATSFTLKFFL